MIEPTVSRMVWYRPGPSDCAGGERPIQQIDENAPLHAMICGVLGPGRVNLAVFGADGSGPHPRVDVALVQDGPVQPGQCTWMPYQKGQAAKVDEVKGEGLKDKPAPQGGEQDPANAPAPAELVTGQHGEPAPNAQPEQTQSETAPQG